MALAGCSAPHPAFDAEKQPLQPNGFVHLHPSPHGQEEGGFWRWHWERWRADLLPDRLQRVARALADVSLLLRSTNDPTVAWLGHATTLWQITDFSIVRDRHFEPRASPVLFAGPRRLTPPPKA